uniref:Uncharacterized protein n=1 Tax=Rhizophora mucronata TaxID=61149 RepID=A0A2P2PCK7_RHIMU
MQHSVHQCKFEQKKYITDRIVIVFLINGYTLE